MDLLLTSLSRYGLRVLAGSLGITDLQEQCLSKLVSETEDMLRDALSEGVTLRQVLGIGPELAAKGGSATPADNVVQVVFRHVLKDTTSPKRLVLLVVNTLAAQLDPGLWDQLASMVTNVMKDRLFRAMLVHRQVKSEGACTPSVKSENASSGDGYATFVLDQQT